MLNYNGMPVLASEAVVRKVADVTVEIGPPQIVAAKDESPDEGTFVAPKLQRFGKDIYLNWSFDWDVGDADRPGRPNGRVSHDGGLTWEKQTVLMPPGTKKYQTGEREITAWSQDSFEIPGRPGVYKIPTWRSSDLGQTWTGHTWTTVEYPGTKGIDIFNPPEEYYKRDGDYLRGAAKSAPPAYLTTFFNEVSRLRGVILLYPMAADAEGTLYSMWGARYLKDTAGIQDWDREYWQRLNWYRFAVLMHVSRDHGRTWTFAGVPVDGSDYEPRLAIKPGGSQYNEDSFVVNPDNQIGPGYKGRVDFAVADGFEEPSLIIFPDGEMLCALRTGANKPLYCVRSYDRGRTWTRAELLSPRYIHPICGKLPQLVLLKNGILALGTGAPDCTVHFSKDRGHTWFLSETLFASPSLCWDGIYSGTHANNSMIAVDDNTLLYVHDATRPDPAAPNAWLQRAGHGIVIARRIEVHAG